MFASLFALFVRLGIGFKWWRRNYGIEKTIQIKIVVILFVRK